MNNIVNINSDLVLFALVKQDDTAAFKIIYDRYWNKLFNSAYSRLKDKEKAQDILQNVFTDLWNRRATLQIENLPAFLHTAVRFQALKLISREPKQYSFTNDFETEIISSITTDGNLIEKETRQIIENFIQALPAKRRRIFIMHYFEELSTARIAQDLNISQKTVQNQLNTTTHALRLRFNQFFGYVVFPLILFS